MSKYTPKMRRPLADIPMSKNGDPDGIMYVVNCWNCRKQFRIKVGYTTDWFDCPHCNKTNEIEE